MWSRWRSAISCTDALPAWWCDDRPELWTYGAGVPEAAELALAVVPERGLQLLARTGVGGEGRLCLRSAQPDRLARGRPLLRLGPERSHLLQRSLPMRGRGRRGPAPGSGRTRSRFPRHIRIRARIRPAIVCVPYDPSQC